LSIQTETHLKGTKEIYDDNLDENRIVLNPRENEEWATSISVSDPDLFSSEDSFKIHGLPDDISADGTDLSGTFLDFREQTNYFNYYPNEETKFDASNALHNGRSRDYEFDFPIVVAREINYEDVEDDEDVFVVSESNTSVSGTIELTDEDTQEFVGVEKGEKTLASNSGIDTDISGLYGSFTFSSSGDFTYTFSNRCELLRKIQINDYEDEKFTYTKQETLQDDDGSEYTVSEVGVISITVRLLLSKLELSKSDILTVFELPDYDSYTDSFDVQAIDGLKKAILYSLNYEGDIFSGTAADLENCNNSNYESKYGIFTIKSYEKSSSDCDSSGTLSFSYKIKSIPEPEMYDDDVFYDKFVFDFIDNSGFREHFTFQAALIKQNSSQTIDSYTLKNTMSSKKESTNTKGGEYLCNAYIKGVKCNNIDNDLFVKKYLESTLTADDGTETHFSVTEDVLINEKIVKVTEKIWDYDIALTKLKGPFGEC